MAPRPLTSIFMAPPPPSRLTASGTTPQAGSGTAAPAYNPAFPGLPVTILPEGGISLMVPTTAEPEPQPEPQPVWMPKARQGLGIGTVGKSSVWDGMAPSLSESSPVGSRTTSLRQSSVPKNRSHTTDTSASDTDALSDSRGMPKKRHVPRNPLDPHRLALISNALGVSMPLPPRSVQETKAREERERTRKSSLDDARLSQNHARTTSLASFRSTRASPTPLHLRSSPSLSAVSRRPMTSATTFSAATPSQPTRFLLHVYPPPHMPSIHPFASLSPPPGYHSQFRRGTLIALHASLPGQLSAIAKEYGLPSTNGMCVYLLSADYEPPESDEEEPVPRRDERSLGPRIGEEPWKMLWAALLKADREEIMRSYNPNASDASLTSSPASGLTALAGEDSPPPQTLSHKASTGSFSPRPLRTVAAINNKDAFGFKSGIGPLSATSPSSSSALSRNTSLTTTQSRTSSPTTTLSSTNPPTTISIMPTLPIVGKIEFDIDMRRAPWYETFCNRANKQLAQRRLPSRVGTPVGPLATPAPRSADERAASPTPIKLTLPPRTRSASPSAEGATLFPRSPSPSTSKFPMHLQLPSNPANRVDRGLLSPKDAMTPSTAGLPSDWPTEDEVNEGGLGLELSPSSSTVADGMVSDVVAEGGYAALEEEDEEGISDVDADANVNVANGRDPLGDVFPDESWDVSTRAVRGLDISDLPPTRNEPVDDETGELPPIDAQEEVEGVKKLWKDKGQPTLPFTRPTDPSAVIFPRPAPARQRSDSNKRPPPLKLSSTDDLEPKVAEQAPEENGILTANSIVVTGEDGEEDWSWRSSEHIRKERLDELEKALAQLSPRILEPPPELDRPRSPGFHHRMLSGGRTAGRPDPHAPLFMSEELSNLRASMVKNGTLTPNRSGSSTPMNAEARIRMQTEQMRADQANLPPPGTAPPRPKRPQTPVTLNSPPRGNSPPVPTQQRSRFSMDSNGEEIAGLGVSSNGRERANSIMSVKGIKKLWRGRNSTQNLNGRSAADATPPIPGTPNPDAQMLGPNRDSQLPPTEPAHKRSSSSSRAQPAQVAAIRSEPRRRDSSNSGQDPFIFDQDSSVTRDTKDKEKEKAATKSILKKWGSKSRKPEPESDSSGVTSRPESRLSPRKGPLNGLAGGHSARGSVSSVNTLTADMPSRPSVSSSLTSDVEPMTPRMSQFEMVVPAQNQS